MSRDLFPFFDISLVRNIELLLLLLIRAELITKFWSKRNNTIETCILEEAIKLASPWCLRDKINSLQRASDGGGGFLKLKESISRI